MTEIHAGFTLQRIDGSPGERAPGGGYPICPQAKIRIVDQKTRRPVALGEAGELEVLTPHMMSGYFENEAATRDAFTDDGYFRTGDLGFLEADGNFRFLARGGDALRLSGFLVSPAEVSFCVETHPSVRRCEVVGVPRDAGMIAVGFVITEPGVPFEEDVLVAHCRRNLATYKVPARFVQLDAFPTTEGANGPKVQRAKLREMAGSLTELTAPKQH
jgi:fatty-acyl-CoA synthase